MSVELNGLDLLKDPDRTDLQVDVPTLSSLCPCPKGRSLFLKYLEFFPNFSCAFLVHYCPFSISSVALLLKASGPLRQPHHVSFTLCSNSDG